MLNHFINGLLLGLAYVAPIGMQNLYVINTALKSGRLRAYQVALITIIFDITLALSCFFGIGLILDKLPGLRSFILAAGSLVILYIGVGLLRSRPSVSRNIPVDEPLLKVAAACFTVTWFNPQAIIDGTLLLGGFRATLPAASANLFIMGVAAASIIWFTSLATLVSYFRNMIGVKTLRIINILCGTVIIYFGLKLVYGLISSIHI